MCVCEREIVCVRERECVCVCERERERVCVCVCAVGCVVLVESVKEQITEKQQQHCFGVNTYELERISSLL